MEEIRAYKAIGRIFEKKEDAAEAELQGFFTTHVEPLPRGHGNYIPTRDLLEWVMDNEKGLRQYFDLLDKTRGEING